MDNLKGVTLVILRKQTIGVIEVPLQKPNYGYTLNRSKHEGLRINEQAMYVLPHIRLRGVSPRPHLQILCAWSAQYLQIQKDASHFLLSVPLLKS